jgi:glutamate-ammonia-ligase adenylyltransferase
MALKRILQLIETVQRRTTYIALLLENPNALHHLIRLATASSWIVSFLAQHPVLLDELIDPRTLYSPPKRAFLQEDLCRRLKKFSAEELEYQIEEMCIFKQINILRVAAADITGHLPLMKVSDYLSDIAESILEKTLAISWNHLAAKHGTPSALLDQQPCEKGFAVIAYGKLGGLELGYGSDLDIVFIHAGTAGQTNGRRPIDNSQFFARLGQRVIHILSSHTPAGKIYEIDMRLRPSGSAGILVSHFSSYQHYQAHDAWTWEHQALLRARPILGDDSLTRWFHRIRKEILSRPREKKSLRKDVRDMREKMRGALLKPHSNVFDIKQDRGGIVDIEFIVQYLVLLHAHQYPELLNYPDNVRQIQSLAETGILKENTAHLLRRTYLVYRATTHRLDLSEKSARLPGNTFSDLRRRIQEMWNTFLED